MAFNLNTYSLKPTSGNKPKQVVVLLHGYGSNGEDLISLAPYWQKALPDAVFLSPDAPHNCEIAPNLGFQWFSLKGANPAEDLVVDRDPTKYLNGVREAAPVLSKYLDEVLDHYGLENENMALVGFSQGCMMALHVGLRRGERVAGILGYSGSLIDVNGLDVAHKVPIHLMHGQEDEVVPIESYYHAKEALQKAGFDVSGHSTPHLGHSIDEDGVEAGARFLQSIFG